MAARGEQCEQNSLPGAHQRSVRGAKLPSRRPRPFGNRRNVDELHQRRSGSGRFQPAPIDVVAEIAPGIARQAAARACGPRGAEQPVKRRAAAQRGLAGRNLAFGRTKPGYIGKQNRHRIARARLDAHERRASRKSEHQHDVRLVFCDQLRQVAIDGRVAGLENVHRAPYVRKRRPPPLRERQCNRPARIERRAGKAAEAGDKDARHRPPMITSCTR